nr:spermatogenesis-associated protein 31D1-like [Equus asinus]
MEFSQWNVLSFLNCPFELCLNCGSALLDTDPNLTILWWLLLLLLCYLVGIPSLPTFWKAKDFQKHQGRARRRKGGTSRGWRYYERETEEKRKLISILKRPLHGKRSRGFKRLENRVQSRKVSREKKDGEWKLKEGEKKMISQKKPRMHNFWKMASYLGFLHQRS